MKNLGLRWGRYFVVGMWVVQGILGEFAYAVPRNLPHLDLEIKGAEYSHWLRSKLLISDFNPIMRMGKRNLDWLNQLNAARPGAAPLSFSKAGAQQGFPIESPRVYSPAIIQKQFEDLMITLPQAMKSVLVDGAPLTDTLPIAEKTYLEFGLEVDRVYQIAARWMLLEPYLPALADRKKQDVRGYYFLQKEENLPEKLNQFKTLSAEQQRPLAEWLTGICAMQNSERRCRAELQVAVQGDSVDVYYRKYHPYAQEKWDEFFKIPEKRSDVRWAAARPELMSVPFLRPSESSVVQFLMNIEEEWRFKDWRIGLAFTDQLSADTIRLEFKAGVTPNVDRLAGNIITLDANAPLSEFEVQWTIRHEFGHSLGFPDCYLEFYDEQREEMVSYQLDTTNLMCSRRGHLQEKHYVELKRVYFSSASDQSAAHSLAVSSDVR